MSDEYVARGVGDACVAIGIAVLDLLADGAERVSVTRDNGDGWTCTEETDQ